MSTGSTSVTVTPVAPDGPPFVTVSVYVRTPPSAAGSRSSIFVISTSADGVKRVGVVARSFSGFGSATPRAARPWPC